MSSQPEEGGTYEKGISLDSAHCDPRVRQRGFAPPASAASGPLAGTWTSVDIDGSNQTLDIMGSGSHAYSMIYSDESATNACDGDPAVVSGPGFVDGDHFSRSGLSSACQEETRSGHASTSATTTTPAPTLSPTLLGSCGIGPADRSAGVFAATVCR